MSGRKELMRYVAEKICEQEKGFEHNMEVQNYLIRLQNELENSTSYEEFIQKLVQEEGDEKMSSIYKAITNLIKTVLKECCDTKTKAEYMLAFMKEMISELNEAVKASRVYEKVKG